MSYRSDRVFSFKPEAATFKTDTEESLNELFVEILANGVYGFCFSLYEEGQRPGDIVTKEQIRRRLEILQPHTKWIRSFSCTEGNEWIPELAKEYGMKTLVGAWLGKDEEKNQQEIEGLLQLVSKGCVDIGAVGNEVLYRNDLPVETLLHHIQNVKSKITGIPVGYVDAYYEFTDHPEIVAACDVVLCNCYPFWEGCPYENAVEYMKQMYAQAQAAANGKPVLITETGWPSKGENVKAAMPSEAHARDYFINTQIWSANENIPVFYFSSFDESWKTGDEGIVGAYWGIWDSKEKLKYV